VLLPLRGDKNNHIIESLKILLVMVLIGFWHAPKINWLLFGLFNGTLIVLHNYLVKFRIFPIFFGWVLLLILYVGSGLLHSLPDINAIQKALASIHKVSSFAATWDLWKYSLVAIDNSADLENYIQTAIDAREHKTAYAFIVFDKLLNEYVGCTRFYDMQLAYQTTQLGYTWYSKKCWGTKLNENCKHLLLEFAFDQMGLERVEFRADNNNKRSIAAMQKIGCTVEGVLRNHLPMPTGKRRDSIVLSILKEDWNDSLKQALAAQLKA
jgi:RimJ/RimL family protein N-acetyltransferase